MTRKNSTRTAADWEAHRALCSAVLTQYHDLSNDERLEFVGWLISSDPEHARTELERFEAYKAAGQ